MSEPTAVLTPSEAAEIEAAAKAYVENHPDVEVRRMYGHYFRVYIAGATFMALKGREREAELNAKAKLLSRLHDGVNAAQAERISELESLLAEREKELAQLNEKYNGVC
jgi:hypothetical protein